MKLTLKMKTVGAGNVQTAKEHSMKELSLIEALYIIEADNELHSSYVPAIKIKDRKHCSHECFYFHNDMECHLFPDRSGQISKLKNDDSDINYAENPIRIKECMRTASTGNV